MDYVDPALCQIEQKYCRDDESPPRRGKRGACVESWNTWHGWLFVGKVRTYIETGFAGLRLSHTSHAGELSILKNV